MRTNPQYKNTVESYFNGLEEWLKNNLNSKIILKTDLEYLNDTENNYNIVLNQNSMPEMTDEIVEEYLNKISNDNLKYFISFNHEAINRRAGPVRWQIVLTQRAPGFRQPGHASCR